ncbi:hypothetical protein CYMTET_33796, partial [Cymbomonas tetramitiformis]
VVSGVGLLPYGDVIHDVLQYEVYVCNPRPGLGVDPAQQQNRTIHYLAATAEIPTDCATKLQTCSATVGTTDVQRCGGWRGATVGQFWGLKITATGGRYLLPPVLGVPWLREVYWYGQPAPPPPSPPPPPPCPPPPPPSPPNAGTPNLYALEAVSTNCGGDPSLTSDGFVSNYWHPDILCRYGSNDWWLKYTLAAEHVVTGVGILQLGNIYNDILAYDVYLCNPWPGPGVDPDLQTAVYGHRLPASSSINTTCTCPSSPSLFALSALPLTPHLVRP